MEKLSITSLEAIPSWARGCVLTVGNFDGVHLGHQRILLNCRTIANRSRCAVAAMTFDPLPEAILYPNQAVPPLIYPPAENARLLLEAGADLVVTVPTRMELLQMAARDFVDDLLIPSFGPSHMVEGANFFFGRGRGGNVVTLENMGVTRGFAVTVLESVVLNLQEGQRRVSSTLIREMIREGQMEDATFCLGREFTLFGRVVGGEQRGRELQFPTANLKPVDTVIPADGVYAARAVIEGQTYAAAVSIGNKPTFGRSFRTIEAFLLDASGDFYDKPMALTFVRRLRGQTKFPDAEALKAQIQKDVEDVRAIIG